MKLRPLNTQSQLSLLKINLFLRLKRFVLYIYVVCVRWKYLILFYHVQIKIRQSTENRTKRVKVSGWVHRLRVQGKDMMFIILRDGSGYLQCVLTGKLVSHCICVDIQDKTLTMYIN